MSVELALELNEIDRPKILVVGDYIVDRDVHCEPVRFAQEAAHCPVWKEVHTVKRPGGAGAVDAMVSGLGAESWLVPEWSSVSAAKKTRYFINGVQQQRIDADAKPLDIGEDAEIVRSIVNEIKDADCVLIADYGKGTCTDAVLRAAIDGAAKRGIPCIADPHQGPWERFAGVTAIKCNQHQQRQWEESNVIVTQAEQGIIFYQPHELMQLFKWRKRDATCVVGAGDMVLATLGVCIAGGLSWPDACKIANAAAGLKVERRGAVPVPRCEVVVDLLHGIKLVPAELLPAIAQTARNHKGKVVWSNGCFDALHKGHRHMLAEAKAQGDLLIVGVNSDESVQSRKGRRPIHSCDERREAIGALECVDYVVEIKSQRHLAECIEAVVPYVLTLGSDYRGKDIVGAEHAGRVHFVERLPGYSSTLERMRV